MLRRFSFWASVATVGTVMLYVVFNFYVLVYHLDVDQTKLLWASAIFLVAMSLGFVGLRGWRRIRFARS